jgi:hypothetical protein
MAQLPDRNDDEFARSWEPESEYGLGGVLAGEAGPRGVCRSGMILWGWDKPPPSFA